MKRISTSTKETDKFGAGKHGFRGGNPGLGILATKLEPDWFDHAQEELARAIEGFGITLDDAQRDQLLKALKRGGTVTGIVTFAGDKTLADDDWGKLHAYTGVGGHTFDWTNVDHPGLNFQLVNLGAGNITLNPTGAQTIDGVATIALTPGQSVRVMRVSDAAAIVTAAVGYGASKGQPYDVPFMAGWGSDFAGEDLAVQTFGVVIVPRSIRLTGASGHLATAATGAACIVDVRRNGTSVFSVLPQFAAGANTLTAGTLDPAQIDVAAGDRLDFLVTQRGSSVRGQRLRFALMAETR